MDWLKILVFALALNVDSFSTGVAYGVKRIRLPFLAILVLSAISAGAITASMLLGNLISPYLSPGLAHRIGGCLLVFLGAWVAYQGVKSQPPTPVIEQETFAQPVVRLKINLGRIIIQVLSRPQYADLDASGDISISEAVILGFALALDSFSTGFAVSMLGFSITITALAVGLGHILLIYPGLWLGKLVGSSSLPSRISVLPGCILMFLGIYKLL